MSVQSVQNKEREAWSWCPPIHAVTNAATMRGRESVCVCEEDKKTALGHRTKNQKGLNYSINNTVHEKGSGKMKGRK